VVQRRLARLKQLADGAFRSYPRPAGRTRAQVLFERLTLGGPELAVDVRRDVRLD
jgi:hypothetical protein